MNACRKRMGERKNGVRGNGSGVARINVEQSRESTEMRRIENMRKRYLDNIRWMTILLVVIFHVFFYYNNIGTAAMFEGLGEYEGEITFGGIYQYFVYPWFMLLLFVVAGISARAALSRKSERQFWKERVDKVLVPSTLGVPVFGWIGGYVIYLHTAGQNLPPEVPGFVGVIIVLSCGIGGLWFCHVLVVAVLVLLLLRKLLRRTGITEEKISARIGKIAEKPVECVIPFAVLFLVLWGGSHVLNMPLITSYRNGIYIPAFLAGYYVFSEDRIMDRLKKAALPMLLLSLAAGVFYMVRCYGLAYTDTEVLARCDLNFYAFCMVLLILGAGARFLDFETKATVYLRKCCFGIYIFHIPVLLVINYLLVGSGLPMPAVYLTELLGALGVSVLLYEAVRRIPVLRYWILGIRRQKR